MTEEQNSTQLDERPATKPLAWSKSLSNRAMAICLSMAALTLFVIWLKVPVVSDLLLWPERRLQDEFFRWREAASGVLGYTAPSRDDIVLVTVDDESIRYLGLKPPWPRQIYALITDRLQEAGARAIAFHMVFEGSSARVVGNFEPTAQFREFSGRYLSGWTLNSDPAVDDGRLVEAFSRRKNIVLATNIELSYSLYSGQSKMIYHAPEEMFVKVLGGSSTCLGNVFVQPDSDHVVRQATLVADRVPQIGGFYTSFALRATEKMLGAQAFITERQTVLLKGEQLPRRFQINFAGSPGAFTSIPAWRVLAQSTAAEASPGRENPFAGRLVVIGYREPSKPAPLSFSGGTSALETSFITPVSSSTRPMSGLELQANIIANILARRVITEAPPLAQALIVLGMAFLLGRAFGMVRGRPWTMLAIAGAVSMLWIASAFLTFVYGAQLLPCAVPLLGMVLPASVCVLADQNLFAFKERRRHTKLFRHLAADDLADEIDRTQLTALGLEGKRLFVTCLSCEVTNFLSLVRNKSPEAKVNLLNECLEAMSKTIYEQGGIVDRFLTYGLVAIWGGPIPMPESQQARAAAACAMQIQARLRELGTRWAEAGVLSPVETGLLYAEAALDCAIGVSSSEADCGTLSAGNLTAYGAIGHSLESSVKLVQMNRQYGTRCLLSKRTAELIGDQCELREVDRLEPANGLEPESVFELLGLPGHLSGAMEEALSLYAQALSAISQRNYSAAESLLLAAERLAPDDTLIKQALEKCRECAPQATAECASD